MATPTSPGDVTFFEDPTGNDEIDALLFGSKWDGALGTAAAVTVSFVTSSSRYSTSTFDGYNARFTVREPFDGLAFLDAPQKAAARDALAAWAAVARITFTEVTDSATVAGDIRLAFSDAVGAENLAHAYLPFDDPVAGDVWLGPDLDEADFDPGAAGHFVILHELGHAAMGFLDVSEDVGLGGAFLPIALDSNQYTVMSYYVHEDDLTFGTDPFGNEDHPTTPMWLDIQAAQAVYGANMAFNAGNTIYRWDPGETIYMTLWDGGGTDTIDWSNQSRAATIDLRTGKWNSLGPTLDLGDGIRTNENLIIYRGVVIENAKGGAGADRITGNGADNLLAGNGARDTLKGGAGDDVLVGGAGDDRLEGGKGDDTYVPGTGADTLIEADRNGSDEVRTEASFTLPTFVERLRLAGSGDVDGVGNAGANTIVGNLGDNALFGLGGADDLIGGRGRDLLVGGAGADDVRYLSRADGGKVATNVTRFAAGVEGDEVSDFVLGVDRFVFKASAFDPDGVIGPGQVVTGRSFSTISGSFDGTNPGTNANHDAGLATFVFSLADGTLYYDRDGDAPGYTVIAEIGDATLQARGVIIAGS
jgi:serralysin